MQTDLIPEFPVVGDMNTDFTDSRTLINYLSDSFLLDAILGQIQEPKAFSVPTDYIAELETRYEHLMDKHSLDTSTSNKIKEIRKQNFLKIAEAMEDSLSIKINISEEDTMIDIVSLVYSVYSVMILSFKDNISEAVYKHMQVNREHFLNYGNKVIPNGDLSYSNGKYVETNSLLLISEYIIQSFIYIEDNDYLFESIITADAGELASEIVKQAYDVGDVTPDVGFFNYIKTKYSEGKQRRDELESDLKTKITREIM